MNTSCLEEPTGCTQRLKRLASWMIHQDEKQNLNARSQAALMSPAKIMYISESRRRLAEGVARRAITPSQAGNAVHAELVETAGTYVKIISVLSIRQGVGQGPRIDFCWRSCVVTKNLYLQIWQKTSIALLLCVARQGYLSYKLNDVTLFVLSSLHLSQ